MAYKTPPTTSPALSEEISAMVNVFAANSTAVAEKLMFNGLQASNLKTTKVSLPPLVQMVNNILIPTVHFWEGTWSDHPTDSAGVAMRGIVLSTLKNLFNNIFIVTDVPQVRTAAQAWNTKHPTWRDDLQLGKQLLYALGSNEKVAGLFFFSFLSSRSNRSPVAIMTEDPFLGFFFAELCWGSGSNVYNKDYTDIDGLVSSYGWNGQVDTWASTIAGLGDKTVEVATKSILHRYNHITKISRDGSKNSEFRTSWINRLLNDGKSDLMMMVAINEKFNLNTGGGYQLSPAELEHLNRKAECYKKVTIELP
jgi:hypothetical protein